MAVAAEPDFGSPDSLGDIFQQFDFLKDISCLFNAQKYLVSKEPEISHIENHPSKEVYLTKIMANLMKICTENTPRGATQLESFLPENEESLKEFDTLDIKSILEDEWPEVTEEEQKWTDKIKETEAKMGDMMGKGDSNAAEDL